jgi:pyruvoyl-dependent arginine decarboxylase (PvlArgDC)
MNSESYPDLQLVGKVVVVAGAARGIGEAIARASGLVEKTDETTAGIVEMSTLLTTTRARQNAQMMARDGQRKRMKIIVGAHRSPMNSQKRSELTQLEGMHHTQSVSVKRR